MAAQASELVFDDAEDEHRRSLVDLMQRAYSGELAAAKAYAEHAQCVAKPEERARIEQIEAEEWHHRELLGEMLETLGEAPVPALERRAARIGRALGALCHVAGWLVPMYGAGHLESRNVREYEAAARFARDCGRNEWTDCLLEMAEVEWDHEHYFRGQVLQHWLGKRLPIWPEPDERESIRAKFLSEAVR